MLLRMHCVQCATLVWRLHEVRFAREDEPLHTHVLPSSCPDAELHRDSTQAVALTTKRRLALDLDYEQDLSFDIAGAGRPVWL